MEISQVSEALGATVVAGDVIPREWWSEIRLTDSNGVDLGPDTVAILVLSHLVTVFSPRVNHLGEVVPVTVAPAYQAHRVSTRYGVSVEAIHEALSRLEVAGLVSRGFGASGLSFLPVPDAIAEVSGCAPRARPRAQVIYNPPCALLTSRARSASRNSIGKRSVYCPIDENPGSEAIQTLFPPPDTEAPSLQPSPGRPRHDGRQNSLSTPVVDYSTGGRPHPSGRAVDYSTGGRAQRRERDAREVLMSAYCQASGQRLSVSNANLDLAQEAIDCGVVPEEVPGIVEALRRTVSRPEYFCWSAFCKRAGALRGAAIREEPAPAVSEFLSAVEMEGA